MVSGFMTLTVVWGITKSETVRASDPGLERKAPVLCKPWAGLPSAAESPPNRALSVVAVPIASATRPALLATVPPCQRLVRD